MIGLDLAFLIRIHAGLRLVETHFPVGILLALLQIALSHDPADFFEIVQYLLSSVDLLRLCEELFRGLGHRGMLKVPLLFARLEEVTVLVVFVQRGFRPFLTIKQNE